MKIEEYNIDEFDQNMVNTFVINLINKKVLNEYQRFEVLRYIMENETYLLQLLHLDLNTKNPKFTYEWMKEISKAVCHFQFINRVLINS